MKRLLLSLAVIMISSPLFAQNRALEEAKPETPKIDKYFFVMLKTGKAKVDSVKRAELFEGHMSNMTLLHSKGILKVAGPFGKNDKEWRGIFILDCETIEDAKKYCDSDPAVKAGLLEAEIVPWYTEPSNSFKHGLPEKERE